MFSYNFSLALASLKKRKGLTALMIVTIGIGIGMLMTMVTISYQATKVPFPKIADKLHYVQLDSRHLGARDASTWQRMVNLTYRDAMNLFNAKTVASNQTFNFKVYPILAPDQGDNRPIQGVVEATTASFFDMTEAQFIYGKGWSKSENSAPVIVLSKQANERIFSGANSIGQQVVIGSFKATVVGVLEEWQSKRRVFDGSFSNSMLDDAFVPYQFAIDSNFQRVGSMRCHPQDNHKRSAYYSSDVKGLMNSECTWINFWAQIDDPQDVQKYHEFTEQYVTEQKEFGRFERPTFNLVTSLKQQANTLRTARWTEQLTMMAYLFFFVCLVNAVGMLSTKFLANSKQVSLRRALGARKKVIMTQYLMEVLMIGVIGGIVGVIISLAGLELMMQVRYYASDYNADIEVLKMAYSLDWQMIGTAYCVAISATIIVGLYPIWRIVNINPASQLKG